MNKLAGIALGASLMAATVFASIGCSTALGSADKSPTPTSTKTPYSSTVEDFIEDSATYKFDGIDGSVKVVKVDGPHDGKWVYTVEYQTRQPGHGDRSGQMLAQVITTHTAEVEVVEGKVASAVCDGDWDMASAAIEVSRGQEFTLPVGQAAKVLGADMVIRFDSVTSDSRAPLGAQAIWAGEAKIQLQITHRGSTSSVTLTETGLTDGYTLEQVDEHTLSFRLQPYPEVDKHPAPGDYKLLLKVTGPEKR